jgi:enoyl-CoA hydratase/carnithine racemase
MPNTPTLLIHHDALGIATLTFNRPEVHNALDWPTMGAFAAAVEALHARAGAGGDIRADGNTRADGDDRPGRAAEAVPSLRAVILTGAGTEAFCSGGDQRALHTFLAESDGARLAATMGDALLRLEQLPVPVIAAVNGYALGGGSEIALACDLRVVAEDVRFGLVHLRLGLIPGWGGGQRLQRLVGYGRALHMLVTAQPFGATALVELGLACQVTPPGAALPAARALAAEITAADPATVRAVKRLLQAGRSLPYPQALAEERALFPALWAAEAHIRAVAGFVERDSGSSGSRRGANSPLPHLSDP